jgi:hypothetical protein
MTASSGVVLGNLAYLIGAVVLAFIGGLIVWLRHRQPKSVDANVESFSRGLRALAPDASTSASRRAPAGPGPSVARIQPRPVLPAPYETHEPPVDAQDSEDSENAEGAEEEQSPAGAEPTDDPAGAAAPAGQVGEVVVDLSSPEMRDSTPVKRAGAETG